MNQPTGYNAHARAPVSKPAACSRGNSIVVGLKPSSLHSEEDLDVFCLPPPLPLPPGQTETSGMSFSSSCISMSLYLAQRRGKRQLHEHGWVFLGRVSQDRSGKSTRRNGTKTTIACVCLLCPSRQGLFLLWMLLLGVLFNAAAHAYMSQPPARQDHPGRASRTGVCNRN